jgi:hypothetical protein
MSDNSDRKALSIAYGAWSESRTLRLVWPDMASFISHFKRVLRGECAAPGRAPGRPIPDRHEIRAWHAAAGVKAPYKVKSDTQAVGGYDRFAKSGNCRPAC